MHKQRYTLITGASQGFGKALALECARRGQHLVLVSLPDESLPELATSIQREFGVEAVAIETDLCEEGACQALFNTVKALGIQVNMLVNNAGIGGTEFFGNETLARYERQITLNVLVTTRLTHLFLPMLQQNSPAHLLNVGSLASFFSLPKKQVYGATKSFVYYFSRSLRRELKEKQVFVSVVCPGGMYTNPVSRQTMASGNYLSRTSGMQPEEVAPIVLNGLLRKKEVIIPGKINWWLLFLDRFVPRCLVRLLEERTMKRLQAPTTATVYPLESRAAVYDLPAAQAERIRSSHQTTNHARL